jgi:hypothetical protein
VKGHGVVPYVSRFGRSLSARWNSAANLPTPYRRQLRRHRNGNDPSGRKP